MKLVNILAMRLFLDKVGKRKFPLASSNFETRQHISLSSDKVGNGKYALSANHETRQYLALHPSLDKVGNRKFPMVSSNVETKQHFSVKSFDKVRERQIHQILIN